MTHPTGPSSRSIASPARLLRKLAPSPAAGGQPTLRVDQIRFRTMTEPDARQITSWRYPAPYDFYDLPEEAWPDLLGLGQRFLAADLPAGIVATSRHSGPRLRLPRRTRLRGVPVAPDPDAPVLGGFVCFGHEAQVGGARNAGLYREPALDIGLGLRPDLTGRGLGAPFFAACLDLAMRREPDKPLRLAVATFNERAITTYRRAGFREAGRCMSPVRGREVPFLVMVRPPAT
ncbi:MAG TPA: GNAT family protein [Thermomicrobiales bacterium]|nr:GNAT family protein [Thermomicrobiales bacterium]